MTILPSILHSDPKRHSLLILQSSLVQSSLPILRSLLVDDTNNKSRRTVLFCLLYPPSTFLDLPSESVVVHDWLDHVPGYRDPASHTELLSIIQNSTSGERFSSFILNDFLSVSLSFTDVIIDSLDTLLSDSESLSETYKCLSNLYALVKKHTSTSITP